MKGHGNFLCNEVHLLSVAPGPFTPCAVYDGGSDVKEGEEAGRKRRRERRQGGRERVRERERERERERRLGSERVTRWYVEIM